MKQHMNSNHCRSTYGFGRVNLLASWVNRWHLRTDVSTCASHISPSPVLLGKHPDSHTTHTNTAPLACVHFKQDPAFPWKYSCYGKLKHQPFWRFNHDIISSNFSGVDKTATHSELGDWQHLLQIGTCMKREESWYFILGNSVVFFSVTKKLWLDRTISFLPSPLSIKWRNVK